MRFLKKSRNDNNNNIYFLLPGLRGSPQDVLGTPSWRVQGGNKSNVNEYYHDDFDYRERIEKYGRPGTGGAALASLGANEEMLSVTLERQVRGLVIIKL